MSQRIHKFENIQALRGIAVLFVVFFHLLVIENKYGNGIKILPQLFNVGAAGVDIFFVISGFIMIAVTQGQYQKQNAITHFLAHRITRIYPLYWFYSLIVLIIFIVHPAWVNQSQGHHVDIVRSFLLLPQNQLPLVLVGWTLIHEMYFYIIIALTLFFPEKHLSKLLSAWITIIVLSAFFITPNYPSIKIIIHPLTCEFIAGCFISRLLFINKNALAWLILISGCLLLLIGFNAYCHYFPGQIPDGWSRIGLFGIPSFLLVYAGVLLEKNAILFPSLLRKLGDASYSIYLCHILVLSALGRIFAILPVHNKVIHLFALIFMIFAVVMVGKASYLYIEKPLIRFFRNKINIKYAVTVQNLS